MGVGIIPVVYFTHNFGKFLHPGLLKPMKINGYVRRRPLTEVTANIAMAHLYIKNPYQIR